MRTRKIVAAAVAATFGLTLAVPTPAHAAPAATDPLWGITATNKLITFNAGTPGTTTANKAITGLGLGETIVGSDVRPTNGAIYALTGAGKLYTVDPTTAVASYVSTLSTALTGTAFDVDFNPVVDRLRVVSNTGQNLRVDVDSGTVTVDTAITGTPTPTETAVGYTNPVAGAIGTTLYGIDTTADNLITTASPNTGAATVVGPLGVNAGDVSSLDVAADGTLVAAITLQGAANTGYYTINPGTGAATLIGTIGGGEVVTDLNIPLASQLRTFGLAASGTAIATMEGQGVARVSKTVAVTGLQASETLVGIDVRPATNHGELYAMGSTGQLYVVDPSTGVATAKGAPVATTLTGDVSIDFNPVVDLIRVITSSGQNLKVNPDTGAVTTDATLAYAAGDAHAGATPSVVGIGYTNSAPGATSTALFGIDSTQQTLVSINVATGALTTVGTSLGLTASTMGLAAGFDVGPTNIAYMVNTFSAVTTLYRVDLTTGVATAQGVVPASITDIARNDQPGYNFVAADGGVFSFGGARFAGSTGSLKLNKPVVGMSSRTPGQGYWLVASDGGIFTFGGATFYGSTGSLSLNKPVVGMSPTPSGKGYWLVASDGGVFSFGDAAFWGSTGAQKINKPIIGMASTKTGLGYYLFAADGGVFTFGDAKFYGSAVPSAVGKTIVGAGLASNGQGYYFAASDGTVYTNGPGAQNKGGVVGSLNKPIVGISVDPSGRGYWLTAGDGGVFSFGPNFYGSTGALKLNQPVVGISAS